MDSHYSRNYNDACHDNISNLRFSCWIYYTIAFSCYILYCLFKLDINEILYQLMIDFDHIYLKD